MDAGGLTDHVKALEKDAAEPGLWDDQQSAQALLQRLAAARSELDAMHRLRDQMEDLEIALELAALDAVGFVCGGGGGGGDCMDPGSS